MDGGLMMEPELSQAVKIVLKYEIQSLLSRLSDAGEEYIVLTASTDDGTCGHLGSSKGEGFVQKSSLQSIKQDFLNFCTGKTKPDVPAPAFVPKAPSKPNRRKSTPRCKFSRSKPETAELSNPAAEFTQTNNDQSFPVDASSALNFNEKSVGYSYTLDNEADLNAFSNSSDIAYNERVIENPDINKVAPPTFTWTNDQATGTVLKTLPVNGNDHFVSGIKMEPSFDESVTPLVDRKYDNIPVLDQLPPTEYTLNNCESKIKVQPARKNRRKAKRAPVKIEKKNPSSLDMKFALNESSTAYLNSDGIKIEPTNAVYNVDLQSIGDQLPATQNHMKAGGGRKVVKKNLSSITDMKSAFEEIGNMAKCLICNKILANKNNRTFHWRSHVGDKRYSCDICNKAFTHPSNMRSHRKIHTDEKPFPCDLCERRFRRRDYLLQHLERFHYNPKAQSDKTLNEGELEVKTEENQPSEMLS